MGNKQDKSSRKPGETRGRKGKGDVELAATIKVEALRLRQAGASYREIGAQLGINHATAFNYVRECLQELGKVAEAEADVLRTLELSRLDKHEKSLALKCAQGDRQAIETCLKIMERRAKLLGLDSPDKHQHEHKFRSGMETLLEEVEARLKTPAAPASRLPQDEQPPAPSSPPQDKGTGNGHGNGAGPAYP